MIEIELIPNLEHCVETIARKEYQRLMQEYLAGKGSDDFEEKVDMLRTFLETADFRKLRQESEAELLKGRAVKFALRLVEGETSYNMLIQH